MTAARGSRGVGNTAKSGPKEEDDAHSAVEIDADSTPITAVDVGGAGKDWRSVPNDMDAHSAPRPDESDKDEGSVATAVFIVGEDVQGSWSGVFG
jgi:hypothetical protein